MMQSTAGSDVKDKNFWHLEKNLKIKAEIIPSLTEVVF